MTSRKLEEVSSQLAREEKAQSFALHRRTEETIDIIDKEGIEMEEEQDSGEDEDIKVVTNGVVIEDFV